MLRKQSERGEGRLGCLVGLIFLLLAGMVAYKMIPVKVKSADLRDTVKDYAKSAGQFNNKQIIAAILKKADQLELPITQDNIEVTRGGGQIKVEVDYEVPIEFPGYTYNWHFNHTAENPIF